MEAESMAKTIEITSRVPQGSMLEPSLWNVMYDALLRMEMPLQSVSFGFADNIVIVIRAKDETAMVEKANITMQQSD